ncbi:MAG TPA: peptidylprolyl isomerase [Sulfurimonas sp.]|nr:peptidylprolyl isomerase [Sulfurimonas sp.]
MITWMQRHRKYLNITLWISVGAFVAAGPMFAIGSASFSGGGADTVAKVGKVDISVHQMNSAYRQLFSRYNQMFQGKFDEAQAKAFGLEKQALKQLIDEALLLNLAQSFKLEVSDKETAQSLIETEAFYKDGRFNKETYLKVLKQARLTKDLYEADVRRSLLLQKVMGIVSAQSLPLEEESLSIALNVQDKINYKVLDISSIKVSKDEALVKSYWEGQKLNYMTEPTYELEVVTQESIVGEYTDQDLLAAYAENKHDFKKDSGEILTYEESTENILSLLNKKASNKEALRTYISYKKDKLEDSVAKETLIVSQNNNPLNIEVYKKLTKLTQNKPYLKPQYVNGKFLIIKLVKENGSKPKTFEEAKAEVEVIYLNEETDKRFTQLAKNSVENFTGKTSPFLTHVSISKLAPLNEFEAGEFLEALFTQNTKKGFIPLENGKIVLFNILEQKLLEKENNTQVTNVLRLKTSLLNEGLLKKLEVQYPVTSYIEGK